MWHQLYQAPRAHKKPRLDKGLSRKNPSQSESASMTETWIRQRRLSVAAQVSKHGSSKDYVDDDDDGLCWGDTHEREAKFQSASRLKRKVQALRDGVLLPSEADQELEDYIRNMKAPLPANQITTKERNKNTLYKGPEKAGFLAGDDGMHVTAFVCTGAHGALASRLFLILAWQTSYSQRITSRSQSPSFYALPFGVATSWMLLRLMEVTDSFAANLIRPASSSGTFGSALDSRRTVHVISIIDDTFFTMRAVFRIYFPSRVFFCLFLLAGT